MKLSTAYFNTPSNVHVIWADIVYFLLSLNKVPDFGTADGPNVASEFIGLFAAPYE